MSDRFRPPADADPEEPRDGDGDGDRPSSDENGGMIDLPLGGSERPGARVHAGAAAARQRRRARDGQQGPAAAPEEGQQPSAEPRRTEAPRVEPPVPPVRAARAAGPPASRVSGTRRRWLWIAALVAVAAAIGYLVPRPGAPVVGLSVSLLDFGAPEVGEAAPVQPITLTNNGQRELVMDEIRIEGEAASDYILQLESCTGRPLPAEDSCSVEVSFQPSSPGPRSAELRIDGNASNSPVRVPLTGAGAAPEVGLDRDRLAFDPQAVGSRSAAQVVTVTNSGSATLDFGAASLGGEEAADFAMTADGCSERRLEPGGGCSLQVSFAPRQTGDRSASIRIPSNVAGGMTVVLLRGEGEAGDLVAELDETGLDFGAQTVGTAAAARSVTLRNSGAEPLSVGRLALRDEVGFALSEDGCSGTTLEAEASCAFGVIFEPTESGAAETSIRIPFGDLGGALEEPLRGSGTAPLLSFAPSSLDFGGVASGEAAGERSVTILNTGENPIELTGSELSGADASSFTLSGDGCTRATLEPGRECEVRIGFRPTSSGSLRARLVVSTDREVSAGGVDLTGVGVAASLELSSSRLDFGDVDWESASRQRLTLRNGGNASLTLRRIEIVGEASGEFRIERTTCSRGGSLKPGLACGMTLVVRPSVEGARSAQLRIEVGGIGKTDVPLRARVLPPPVPVVRVAPAVLDVGSRRVGERSSIQTVTVQSVGSGPLVLGEARLEGEHAGDYYLVPGSCRGMPRVLPGTSCTVGIRFVPRAAGERRAQLIVPHNGESGRSTVALVGQGGATN